MNLNTLYTKKRIAYELINSSIDLFLNGDEEFDIIIYNSVYTAWNLLWEIKKRWESEAKQKFRLELEKEKQFAANKKDGNDVNAFWNYMKHSRNQSYNNFVTADMPSVNFNLLFSACQDFLRVFSIVDINIKTREFDIEKFKVFSLTFAYIKREENQKLYEQLVERKENQHFFASLIRLSTKIQDDFELLKYCLNKYSSTSINIIKQQ